MKVFISHAREDRARYVNELAIRLSEDGVEVWFDDASLEGDVVEGITDAIRRCDAMLVVLSAASVVNRWVQYEISLGVKRAVEAGMRIVPIVLEDAVVPDALGPFTLVRDEDARSCERTVAKTLRMLLGPRRKAKSVGAATPSYVGDYLAAVSDFCANLPYVFIRDVRPKKTVSDVYVTLRARESRESHGRHSDVSISDIFRFHGAQNVVVIGAPGSGKSTLGRYLTEKAWNSHRQLGLEQRHMPMLVSLPRLSSAGGSLESALKRVLEDQLPLKRDLPLGFLEAWPRATKAPWLFVFDALDEVPAQERPRLLQWLSRTLTRAQLGRFILLTRASGYQRDDLAPLPVKEYEVLPFDLEQAEEFADRWFGRRSKQFLAELARLELHAETPLLLTIAAKVFLEHERLPRHRSTLYAAFVEIQLEESKGRGLARDVGDRFAGLASFFMGRLALAVTRSPIARPDEVRDELAGSIAETFGMHRTEASVEAQRLIEAFVRRSGLLAPHSDRITFLHPTFQEHLTAKAILQECRMDAEALWDRFVSRWATREWREVSVFILRMLSDEGKDVTWFLEKVLQSVSNDHLQSRRWRRRLFGGNGPLTFLLDALSDGVTVSVAYEDQLASLLTNVLQAMGRKEMAQIELSHWGPLWALSQLGRSRVARKTLRRIIRRPRQAKRFYAHAFKCLARLRLRVKDIDAAVLVASDTSPSTFSAIDFEDRFELMVVLVQLGHSTRALEIAHAILTNPSASRLDIDWLVDGVCDALAQCSDAEIAQRVLVAICRRTQVDVFAFERLLRELANSHPPWAISALSEVCEDPLVDDFRRCDAAQALVVLGAPQQSARILLQMQRYLEDSYAREYAARLLKQLPT